MNAFPVGLRRAAWDDSLRALTIIDESAIHVGNSARGAPEHANPLARSAFVGIALESSQGHTSNFLYQPGVPVSAASRNDENHSRLNQRRLGLAFVRRQPVNAPCP